MARGDTLRKAKENKNDEFYTQLSDIEKELSHYKHHFKDKVIFCNCDDPEWSNFWKYFSLNFDHLGLKKLIATHYDKEKPTYKLELVRDINKDGRIDGNDTIKTPLKQNGDFRSPKCIEILKEADIVVSNCPFSLFRQYIAQLIEYNKKFIIWGNNNAITYKEVFPLIKDNKVWLGYLANSTCIFRIPNEYKKYDEKITQKINDGNKYAKVPAISVFTNLDIPKRHEKMILYKQYYGHEDEYPKYDNYDAINVDKVKDIPCDYEGAMSVPISFLSSGYNPEQFVLIGIGTGDSAKSIGITKNYRGRTDLAITINKKSICPYNRILIKKK